MTFTVTDLVYFVGGFPEAPISPLNDGSHIVKRTPSSHPPTAGGRSVCLAEQWPTTSGLLYFVV